MQRGCYNGLRRQNIDVKAISWLNFANLISILIFFILLLIYEGFFCEGYELLLRSINIRLLFGNDELLKKMFLKKLMVISFPTFFTIVIVKLSILDFFQKKSFKFFIFIENVGLKCGL